MTQVDHIKQLHIRRSRLEVLQAQPSLMPGGVVGLLVKLKSSRRPAGAEATEYVIAEIIDTAEDQKQLLLRGAVPEGPKWYGAMYVSNEEIGAAELMGAALALQRGDLLQISSAEALSLVRCARVPCRAPVVVRANLSVCAAAASLRMCCDTLA